MTEALIEVLNITLIEELTLTGVLVTTVEVQELNSSPKGQSSWSKYWRMFTDKSYDKLL